MSNNRSLKKFCRLTKYVEQNNPDLYQVIEDLCIGHYFKPSRDANGITFLFPDKAYAQKIINAAYSTDPDVAVNMLKSLLVHGFYSSTADFKDGVVNLLNQKIEIVDADDSSAKLSNGLVLKKDSAFVPMSYRENMAVFALSGKGEISTKGEMVSVERAKRGGSSTLFSKKNDLHKLLENKYATEINNADRSNIYVKKVCLQLAAIQDNFPAGQIAHCLGNDEFSDSYLLDMFCDKNCPAVFDTLCRALSSNISGVAKLTFEKYIVEKKKVVGEGLNNKNVTRNESNLKGLHSPIDVRTKVCNIYGRDKHKLGIDLFIVFCNISKDLWKNDPIDKENEFRQFAYIASKIYVKPEDLVNQEFDPARDLTLYGNLLKSDVLKYVAQADFSSADSVNLKIVTSLPSPLEMSLFSLCYLTNHNATKVTGGDAEIDALLLKLA
jgi:hypothetical protein